MKNGRNEGAYSKARWIFQPPLYQVRLYKENPIQPYPITIVDVLNTFVSFISVVLLPTQHFENPATWPSQRF